MNIYSSDSAHDALHGNKVYIEMF